MAVTLDGNVIDVSAVQYENTLLPMEVTLDGSAIDLSDVQYENAESPRDTSPAG